MSYSQAMKHSRNHRKDKYYQQCGLGYASKEWAYCVIDSETKEIISDICKTRKEADCVKCELQKRFLNKYMEIVDVCNGRPIIY